MTAQPGVAVLASFGVRDEPELLDGGQGETWRCGSVVLRPSASIAETVWKAGVVSALPDDQAYRFPAPVPTTSGAWTVDGWEAWTWLPDARADETRLADVVRVGNAFHDALADVPRPAFLDEDDSPWSRADRGVWGECPLPSEPLLDRLVAAFAPVSARPRLQHGDLLGNVLFHRSERPAVIDWAPYWRPEGYGTAIAEVDAVCWHGVPLDVLRVRADGDAEDRAQLLVRALAFRIAVMIDDGTWDATAARRHRPVVDAVTGRGA